MYLFIFGCTGSSWQSNGFSLLGITASVVAEWGLSSWGLWAVEHGLSNCGRIFPDQGLNLSPLH